MPGILPNPHPRWTNRPALMLRASAMIPSAQGTPVGHALDQLWDCLHVMVQPLPREAFLIHWTENIAHGSDIQWLSCFSQPTSLIIVDDRHYHWLSRMMWWSNHASLIIINTTDWFALQPARAHVGSPNFAAIRCTTGASRQQPTNRSPARLGTRNPRNPLSGDWVSYHSWCQGRMLQSSCIQTYSKNTNVF